MTLSERLTATLHRIEVHAADHCTLSCVGCNHASPDLPRMLYDVDRYLPWLDLLRDNGCRWGVMSITGGEPFLHKGLVDFARKLKGYGTHLEIVTNAYWLRSEQDIERYADLWSLIDWLLVSRYQTYAHRVTDELLATLRERVDVRHFTDGVVTHFVQGGFTDTPGEIEDPPTCGVRNCTQLLHDGRLARCTYCRVVPSHLPQRDMWYDIEKDERPLQAWHDRWALDTCSYCKLGTKRWSVTPWSSGRDLPIL